MDKIKNPLVILTILVLLVGINLYQNSRLNELENKLNNQMHVISNFQNTVTNVDHSIRNTLANWERETKWIRESNIKILNISDDLEEMTIGINWSFNSLLKDEDIYLMVGQIDANLSDIKWNKYPVDSDNDLSYYSEITIPFKERYSIEIIGDSNGNKRTVKIQEVEVYSHLVDRIQIHGSIHQSNEGAILSLNLFNPPIFLKFFGSEDVVPFTADSLLLKKAIVEVYQNQRLMDTVDLLVDGNRFDQGGGSSETEEIIDFSKIYKDMDVNNNQVKVVFKGEDYLGLLYEKVVELK